MTIKLAKSFAANGKVEEYDVKQVKKALNRLGYYEPYEKVGITAIPDKEIFDALKTFQKDQGFRPTGEAQPDDETVRALNTEVAKTPDGYYIWHSMEDERVRPEHASYDWETRVWSDSPDPGEDYNCRCWSTAATQEQIEKKKKQKCFDGLEWEEDAKENIKDYETDVAYPYLDTASKITIGIGINIDQTKDLTELNWKKDSITGRNATKKEIQDAYQILRDRSDSSKQPKNFTNGHFNVLVGNQENWTNLYLSQDARDALFSDAFDRFRNALPGRFSDFDCFPSPAKVALMDMIFNLGETKFSRGNWPRLFKAVNQRDWNNAAQESSRQGVAEKRNTKTRDLFAEAAEMEKKS